MLPLQQSPHHLPPSPNTPLLHHPFYMLDGWKVAQDRKEGTGNGQGQRIIDNAPYSAKEDAEANVMSAHSSACSGRYLSLL